MERSGRMIGDRNCWATVEPGESWIRQVLQGRGREVAKPALKRVMENAVTANQTRESRP